MELSVAYILYLLKVFLPDILLLRLPMLFVLFLLLFVFRRKEKASLFLLILILSFSVFSSALKESEYKNALNMENPIVMAGRVVGPPVKRGSSSLGYNLLLEGVEDSDGNSATAEGIIYVISLMGDEDYGDRVVVRGKIEDGYFLASKTSIKERSLYGRMRRRIQRLLLSRYGGKEGGNLSSLLLTGTTTNGSKDIQNWAKERGISHLFALSGMHLAFLSGIVTLPLSPLLGKKKARIFSLALSFLFIYINGLRPSLLRAMVFLILSYLLPMEYAYSLSFPILFLLFPYLSRAMGVMLGYVSLYGILMVGKRSGGNLFFTSLGALSSSVPISFRLFGYWAPQAALLSILGGIGVELLFLLVIFGLFIPKIEYIIEIIYKFIPSFSLLSFIPLQHDLTFYPLVLLPTLASVFLPGLFFRAKGGLSLDHVESQLRQPKRNR